MTAPLSALMRWLERVVNDVARFDPLLRARLRGFGQRSIAVEITPPGESVTLHFGDDAVRLSPGIDQGVAVIVRGSPLAIAAELTGQGSARGIEVEGDEVLLTRFRDALRDFRPDVVPPLEELVGPGAAQTIAGAVEVGLSALKALAAGIADEGTRFARAGSRRRFVTTPEVAAFLESVQALRLRADRLAARVGLLETGERAGRE